MKNESVITDPTSFETMMGYAEVTVRIRQGATTRTESVRVMQLEIEQYPEMLKRFDDERAQIELYCQRLNNPADAPSEKAGGIWGPVPTGWAKTLTPDSHDLVMETGERLNRDFFGRWVQRRMAKLEAMRPGVTERMFAVLAPGAKPSSDSGSRNAPSSVRSLSLRPDGTVQPN